MRSFLRFLAVLVAIAAVLTAIAAIFLHATGSRLARAAMYKEALASVSIYDKAPQLVGESLTKALDAKSATHDDDAATDQEQEPDNDPMSRIIRQLEPEDWTALLGAVVPAAELQTQVERVLDSAEGFLHGTEDATAGRLSLVEVKSRLTGGAATEAYATLLARKPECTPEQFDASMGLPVACRPPADKMPQVLDMFSQLVQHIAEQLPDEFDLLEDLRALDGPEGQAAEIERVRMEIRRMEWLADWCPAVPIALALLIAILAVRSGRGLLMWWGVPALVAGGISAIVAGMFVVVGSGLVDSLAGTEIPDDVPVETMRATVSVIHALIRQVMVPALVSALVVGGAGLLALILALVTRPKVVVPPPPIPA